MSDKTGSDSKRRRGVSVIIPAYNEAETITGVIQTASTHPPGQLCSFRMLLRMQPECSFTETVDQGHVLDEVTCELLSFR